MKLKYFLRGLGTGIILTALILCISYRSGKSSESVVDQAKELGMVFPEGTQPPDTFPEETGLPEDTGSPSATAEGTNLPATQKPNRKDKISSSGAGVMGTEETTDKTESKTTSKPEDTDKPEKTKKPKSTVSPEKTVTPMASSTSQKEDVINFEVRSGLLSSTVAREMKEAGIIQNDEKFDEYLEKNGYSKSIKEGTYKITKGASYSDIAKIITRQN